jgi:hypothetical protein
MKKNPWDKQRLESFIGQEESYQLEFKSSLGLSRDSQAKFLFDLTCHVSAFLNSDGGTLIIGIEEAPGKDKKQAEKAIGLSKGIPRSCFTGARLASAICDQIHPSVASYVQVFPVVVGEQNGEDLLAFTVEVAPGVTAYQAADKLYYARRSFSSEAMEDKDIRLRMLADEKPRGELRYRLRWDLAGTTSAGFKAAKANHAAEHDRLLAERGALENSSGEEFAHLLSLLPDKPNLLVNVQLVLFNSGLVTIRQGAVSARMDVVGSGGLAVIKQPEPNLRFKFDEQDVDKSLYPEMEAMVGEWSIQAPWDVQVEEGHLAIISATVFLDNGPAIRADFDLTADIREKIVEACDAMGIARGVGS